MYVKVKRKGTTNWPVLDPIVSQRNPPTSFLVVEYITLYEDPFERPFHGLISS